MIEVEVDPLAYIEFILIVAYSDELDQVVSFSADLGDQVGAFDLVKTEVTSREGQENDMDQGFDYIEFSHELLSQVVILGLLHLHVIFIFRET